MKNKNLGFLFRKTYVTVSLICVMFFAQAQEPGIKFETNLTWKEIQAKAKAENKYIFVDCYASWCVPCKYMSQYVFPKKGVGDYFNPRFISISVQMDSTAKDAESIKRWYANAKFIDKKYKITEYPTFLIFSPSGVAVHRFSGAVQDPRKFIEKAADGLDPAKQYYTVMDHWRGHRGDSTFLINALNMALVMSDDQQAEEIGDEYIRSLKSPMAKNNLETIQQIIYSSSDLSFQLYLTHAKEIDVLRARNNYAEWSLQHVIFQEKVYPICNTNGPVYWKQIANNLRSAYPMLNSSIIELEEQKFQQYIKQEIRDAISKAIVAAPDFNMISKNLKSKYPQYESTTDRLLLKEAAAYYKKNAQWDKCAKAAYTLLNRYGSQISEKDLDNVVWDYVFLHARNKVILAEAAKWMKRGTILYPKEAADLDTYANLLYKLGKQNEAIEVENKVLEIAANEHYMTNDINGFKSTLEKMQKGIKTWQDDTPVVANNTSKN